MPIIKIRELTKSYGDHTVLEGIDFDVDTSQMVVVISPGGSGKSTSLCCYNGLETAEGDTIGICGKRPISSDTLLSDGEPNQLRQQAGMVFQSFNLFPHLSVLHNVTVGPRMLGGRSKHEAKTEMRELLQKVGLAHKADAMPTSLSDGQKQRMVTVRALAMRPKAMLLDEPTSVLGPELVGEVLQMMGALAKEGVTMFVVTREVGFVCEVVDAVVMMNDGDIVETGPPSVIFDEPEEAHTRSFL